MRVSLTPKCNLRCWYCTGRSDPDYPPAAEQLNYEERLRIVRLALERLGIVKIRLTGGEPLLYERLEELIKDLRKLDELQELALTTNGILLAENAAMLRRSGLDRVNVSLEGANENIYKKITGQNCLPQVLRGLNALLQVGFKPKLNVVLCRRFGRAELLELLKIGQQYAQELRFIELMGHNEYNYPSVDDMEKQFTDIAPLTPDVGRGTATRRYTIAGYDVMLGMIPSRTDMFCSSCRRIRLSVEGQLRACLFSRTGTPLLPHIRQSCDDDELTEIVRQTIWQKPSCAQGNQVNMCRVGG